MQTDILLAVQQALAEDVGSGDITAELIPQQAIAQAVIISREHALLCGQAWVEAVFQQLDKRIAINWQCHDGHDLTPDTTICTLTGPARALLTGERCALNFLQTLSGTATLTRQYARAIVGTNAKLLDTRRTLPGLRAAQKYAVICGGGHNHRMGLYDAFLIKENHIHACGSIAQAVLTARELHPQRNVEVEVENLQELHEALEAKADIVLLDNFSVEQLREAVSLTNKRAKLEASGGIDLGNIRVIAESGVDYISVGALTKDVKAVDLSMRFIKWQLS